MQLAFIPYYKNYGIRRLTQLLSPRMSLVKELPRQSMVHYLSEDNATPDLDTSQPYYNDIKNIVVDYHEELSDREGNPVRVRTSIRTLVKPFHSKHKEFRYVPDALHRVKSDNSLFILNYSYLNQLNHYPANPLKLWFEFYNSYRTIFSNISAISETTLKNHFIFIKIPKDIPSYQLLNMCVGKMSKSILKIFDDYESLFLLQCWQWLSGVDREHTIFGKLNPRDYSKTNFVITSPDGRSVILNLGYIDSWIKGHELIKESGEKQQVKPQVMQKLYLRMILTLSSNNPDAEIVEAVAEADGVAAPDTSTPPEDLDQVKELEEERREYQEENEDDEEDAIDAHEYRDSDSGVVSGFKAPNKVSPELVARFSKEIDKDIDKSFISNLTLDHQLKNIDKDLEILNLITTKKLKERGIHLNDQAEEVEVGSVVKEIPLEVLDAMVYEPVGYEEVLKKQIERNADYGMLTAVKYKKLLADIENYKKSPDPYGSNQLAIERAIVTPEDLIIDKEKTKIAGGEHLVDPTMAESSLQVMDKHYIRHVMKKHVLAMVNGIQKGGVIVRRHEIEFDHSALGSYENHTIELQPTDGEPSTLRVRIPVVNEDGSFISNSNKYSTRKQRRDVPIRKINPFTVALSSYYGKTNVTLNQKKANNSLAWIVKEVNKAALEDNHPTIRKVASADVFDNNFEAPYIYNALASAFKSLDTPKYHLTFDHQDRELLVTEEELKRLEKNGTRVVGQTRRKEPIVVDINNNFFIDADPERVPLGDIYQVLELTAQNAPVDFIDLRVFSKSVPVGVVLAYHLGFHNLLKFLRVKYEHIEGRRGPPLLAHQYAIIFNDARYVFDRRDAKSSLIISGFIDFEKQIKQFPVAEFDKKDVYFNLLESRGLGALYLREIDSTEQMFVDAITANILKEMKEPQTFNGLLVRSAELLMAFHHPDPGSMDFQRICGYERFAGAIYKELTTQIRSYKNRNIAGKSKVDMSPYQVWSSIMKDPAVKIVEDINPIQNLKESEIVTYVGEGGRSKDAINKENRAYHGSDMGIISEATVDSSDVGVNTYMSANPMFASVMGTPDRTKELTPAALVSTSFLLAPGSTHDDPKRTLFTSVQNGHTIAAKGYRQAYLQTGYESIVSQRTSDMFSFAADQAGKVISIDEHGVIVEYKDGERRGCKIGRQYGRAEGSIYPHDIVANVKVGQSFEKGHVIAYNTGFFEEDMRIPGRILFKTSMPVKTVLWEANSTHEDSCAVSRNIGQQMAASTTYERSFTIDFNQNLVNVVKSGQKVGPKDFLMIIEDEITSSSDIFDARSLEVLKRLSNQAPRANYLGTVDRIEIRYHGDKKDMTSTLKSLTDRSDRYFSDSARSSNNPVINGSVTDDYRVGGVPLALDKAEVKFYITVSTLAGTGDKLVFANQMKSIIGEVMNYTLRAEDGTVIDAEFGYRSIAARIVESPVIIGTSTTLLMKFAEIVTKTYRN